MSLVVYPCVFTESRICLLYRQRETNRHTDRQTDKHAERQRGRQTGRQANTQTETSRQTDSQADTERRGAVTIVSNGIVAAYPARRFN